MTDTCLPCRECKGKLTHSLTCSKLMGHVHRELGKPCGLGNCDTPHTHDGVRADKAIRPRGGQ